MANHRERFPRLYLWGAIAAFASVVVVNQPTQAQTYKVLYSFSIAPGGGSASGVIEDPEGNLYGTFNTPGISRACNGGGCGVVYKLEPSGKYVQLHIFDGLHKYGRQTNSGVIRDAQGNLYGEALSGIHDSGIVYKLSPAGKETVLNSFNRSTTGAYPVGGLIRDAQQNLYGTNYIGGVYGGGTVFKLSNTRKETVLYSFTYGAGGDEPPGGVIRDAKGNLYGTTQYGGDLYSCGQGVGCGVVFKLDNTGKETVLYSFTGGADGATPEASVIQDAQGNLYGTTYYGGSTKCSDGIGVGCGVVFKLDASGAETVLYSFCSVSECADGANPVAGLVKDAQGNLYGTTNLGGSSGFPPCDFYHVGCGVVFKLDPSGSETVLYSFCSVQQCTDGGRPVTPLIQDAQGNLYGTAYSVLFELTP
jgi:uncharacterized repeat protein (TIGR03803 family)